jgi:hypothetical protein
MYAWIVQIKLLKILAVLGAGDKQASDNLYEVISSTMKRANPGHTIGNAIVYECVRTITSIVPFPPLLQQGGAPSGTTIITFNFDIQDRNYYLCIQWS